MKERSTRFPIWMNIIDVTLERDGSSVQYVTESFLQRTGCVLKIVNQRAELLVELSWTLENRPIDFMGGLDLEPQESSLAGQLHNFSFSIEQFGVLFSYYMFRLQQHMRVHTQETPWLCSVCGAKFSLHSSYRYHIRYSCKLYYVNYIF